MLSLHKGILAFGVELDSYCERETSPSDYSLANVGMGSLLTSKLYGERLTTARTVACAVQSGGACAACSGATASLANCLGASCSGSGNGCEWTAPRDVGLGPGKDNFIGFDTSTCANISIVDNVHRMKEGTATPAACVLAVTSYDIGVAGHISGETYIGFDVNEGGVVGETDEGTFAAVNTGLCT